MILRNVQKLISSSIINHSKDAIKLCTKKSPGIKLMSAVCLERVPVVTQTMNKLEQEYCEMLNMVEKERSLLSDHTLRHLEDLKIAEKKRADEWIDEESEVSMQTALELEDHWQDELKAFKPANRITEADLTNNTRSLDRKLDRKVVLMVKQTLGDTVEWVLPMGEWKGEDSLKQSAERVLREVCGDELSVRFMGNVPCGFYQYNYPPALSHTAAKVFFFKAQYRGGHVKVDNQSACDHQWLLKEELQKHSNKRYAKKINRFIIEI